MMDFVMIAGGVFVGQLALTAILLGFMYTKTYWKLMYKYLNKIEDLNDLDD